MECINTDAIHPFADGAVYEGEWLTVFYNAITGERTTTGMGRGSTLRCQILGDFEIPTNLRIFLFPCLGSFEMLLKSTREFEK